MVMLLVFQELLFLMRMQQRYHLPTLKAVEMVNLRATRYGEVTQVAARTVTVDGDTYYPDEVIAPKTIFDLELSYALAQGVDGGKGGGNTGEPIDPVGLGFGQKFPGQEVLGRLLVRSGRRLAGLDQVGAAHFV